MLTVRCGTGDSVNCRLQNVSRIGAAATICEPIEELSLVQVRFSLPWKNSVTIEVDCQAAVVRCDEAATGEFEIGLYFMDLASDQQDLMDEFIRTALTI